MGGSTRVQTTTQSVDPMVKPYVEYGLKEAQRLYQTETPEYFPGQTYVGPSQQTQQALTAAQQRAVMGSPLLPAAQQQAYNTIQGGYLGGNPFFQGAFQPAAQAAQQTYFDALNQARSNASRAGRYGSQAALGLEERAGGQFAQSLANTAGQLAYQNYEAERARQQAMLGAAPGLAAADYGDIERLAQTGQTAEQYQQAALQDAINRFNFQQGLPSNQLNQYLSAVYGSPQGRVQTTPVYSSRAGGALGGALAGGSMFGVPGAIAGGIAGLLGV
jgi:hypothetical protein